MGRRGEMLKADKWLRSGHHRGFLMRGGRVQGSIEGRQAGRQQSREPLRVAAGQCGSRQRPERKAPCRREAMDAASVFAGVGWGASHCPLHIFTCMMLSRLPTVRLTFLVCKAGAKSTCHGSCKVWVIATARERKLCPPYLRKGPKG